MIKQCPLFFSPLDSIVYSYYICFNPVMCLLLSRRFHFPTVLSHWAINRCLRISMVGLEPVNPLRMSPGMVYLDYMIGLFFLEKPPCWISWWFEKFISTSTRAVAPGFWHNYQYVLLLVSIFAIVTWEKWNLKTVLVSVFLVSRNCTVLKNTY